MDVKGSLSKISLSSREKVVGQIVLVAVIFLVFDSFIYRPKSREGKRIEKEFEAIDQKIQENIKGISSLSGIKQEVQLLEKKFRFYNDNFSKPEKSGALLTQLARLCRNLNIEIIFLNPKEKGLSTPGYKHLYVEMELRCEFKTFVLFMSKLKSLTFFTIVDTMDIERTTGSSSLTFNVVLETFFLSERQHVNS
jgi:Tfp pilus assembly protein PilO